MKPLQRDIKTANKISQQKNLPVTGRNDKTILVNLNLNNEKNILYNNGLLEYSLQTDP